jgi:hypothetical protein
VLLLSPAKAGDYGIRAFDGGILEDNYTFAFWTGDGSESPTRPRRDPTFCGEGPGCGLGDSSQGEPTAVGDFSPLGILRTCASGSSCHGPQGSGAAPRGEALQLWRDDDGGIIATIHQLVEEVNVATETATAANPAAAQRSVSSVFGQNMPYIDAGNPGNSYLLYKLIIGLSERDHSSDDFGPPACAGDAASDAGGEAPPDGGTASGSVVEPWIPDAVWAPAAVGEYDRLREAIRGEPMPYGSGAPWWLAETISAWIAGGATTSSCEPEASSPSP